MNPLPGWSCQYMAVPATMLWNAMISHAGSLSETLLSCRCRSANDYAFACGAAVMKQAKLRSIGIASAVELYDKIIIEHSKVRITIFAFAFACLRLRIRICVFSRS